MGKDERTNTEAGANTIIKAALTTACLFICCLTYGQDQNFIKRIKDSADQLVISFWGKENFKKYITLDSEASSYIKGLPRTKRTTSVNSISFKPSLFYFNYKVFHPIFHGDTARIEFYVDSTSRLEWGLTCNGLYQVGELGPEKTIDKSTAVATAKYLGLKKGRNKWTVELRWKQIDPILLNLNEKSTYLDIIQGYFVWAVKARLPNEYMEGHHLFEYQVYTFKLLSGNLDSQFIE